jgi:DNA ligase D-like protein (predicted ligase)
MSRPLDAVPDDQRELLEEAEVPEWTDPMLATLVDDPLSDEDWIFERKLDGERCLAFSTGGEVRLMSRSRRPLGDTYPELIEPLSKAAADRFVVDGEIVAFRGETTSFERLQQRMQIDDPDEARTSDVAVYYYLFDVLHLDGYDPTRLPLRRRKQLLRDLSDFADPIRYTRHRNERGFDFFTDACRRGWEGLIAKDATAPYVHSRSRKWLKFTCVDRQELVIGGFTDPQGERIGFGAILVGFNDGDDLIYAGKVGTGFDDETLRDLGDRMDDRERDEPAFDRGELPSHANWITPDLVAEVGFTEWTAGGKLRHPRFLGLRRDKSPTDVVKEVPE